jgi:carbon-monoxide dehydrogenase large subunit
MMDTQARRFIGRSIPRREDRRLLLGRGRFIADIHLPGMLHVAFVRSAVAHARIRSIEIARALASPGVVAVFTGANIRAHLEPIPGMQNRPPKAWREAIEHEISIPDQPIIATDKVCYVGEAVAVVVAADRYLAEDAAALVELQMEPLAPIVGIDAALDPAAPPIHDALSTNIIARLHMRKGDADAILASGARVLRHRFDNHRYAGMPIECRGVVAQYDPATDSMTVWSATQVVHWVRREVAVRLALPEARVRCIAPDVGGGFGVKGHVYPEDVLIPYLARRLGRPVKWIEDRLEHILNAAHARDDRHEVEIAFDAEGRILAIRDRLLKDSGAYMPVGVGTPINTAVHLLGPYHVPNYDVSITIVATNKTPNAPYRGAGRPEAAFVMERLMDLIAHALDLDPVTVRLSNMIPPENIPYKVGLPYRDGIPIVYDSGDYPGALRQAVDALGGSQRSDASRRRRGAKAASLASGLVAMSRVQARGRSRAQPYVSTRRERSMSRPAPVLRGRGMKPSLPKSQPISGALAQIRSRSLYPTPLRSPSVTAQLQAAARSIHPPRSRSRAKNCGARCWRSRATCSSAMQTILSCVTAARSSAACRVWA